LIIGSEGTLAIITEATLKLLPQPETKRTFMASYDSMDAAARALSSSVQGSRRASSSSNKRAAEQLIQAGQL